MRAVEAHVLDAVVALDARGFLHTSGHVLADFAEYGDLALDHLRVFAPLHVATDIADEALPGALVPHTLIQDARGVEVLGADLAQEGYGFAGEVAVDLVEIGAAVLEGDGLDRGEVVGAGALVVERHVAVALEVGHAVGSAAAVDGELLVINADAMAVGVRVGEEAGLEDGVCRGLDAGKHMGGIECYLFDFGEVILGVLVELEKTDFAEGELLLGPDVGQIKDINFLVLPEIFGFFGGHGLEGDGPGGVFLALDGFVEVLCVVVWRIIVGVFLRDEFDALIRLHVHLGIDPVTGLVNQLQGVPTVTVHVAVAVRNATVAHQDEDLMNRLGVLGKVVPEHARIIRAAQMGSGIPFLGVDEVGELRRVTQEEDGGVVSDHIPVALVGTELDAEATRIASAVMRTGFATNGGEADGDRAFLIGGAENVGLAQIVHGLGALESPMSTTALGMNDSLGNPFAVEVRDEIDQVEILQQQRTVGADTLGLVGMRHGHAIASGVDGVLGRGVAVVLVGGEGLGSHECG